jgi:two-component system LytT family response regulator
VGECETGRAAVNAIREARPDLVFLDVQMPEGGAFDVIEEVGVEAMPVVVFVTAYDEHALAAFEVHALDYLLKPFARDRFRTALGRARNAVRHRREEEAETGARGRLRALLEDLDHAAPLERLFVREGERVVPIRVEDIDWIEGERNYVRLHVGGATHRLRGTVKSLTQRLDPRRFLRINRSTIVNLEGVQEVQPWFRGERLVILKDGTRLASAGEYGRRLREVLRNPL